MRIFTTFALILQLAVVCVQAGGWAGAYERLFIYFAYRVDLMLPEESRMFLPCAGRGDGGSCLFSDLMMQMEGNPSVKWLPDGMTDVKFPEDIEDAVNHMTDNNLSEPRIKLSQLLKSGSDSFVSGLWHLSGIFKQAKTIYRPWQLAPWAPNAENCLRTAYDQRIYEYHDYMHQQGIDDDFRDEGLTVVTKENAQGLEIYDVQGSAELQANSYLGTPDQVKGKIYTVMDEFNRNDLEADKHNRVIKAENASLGRTNWGCEWPSE